MSEKIDELNKRTGILQWRLSIEESTGDSPQELLRRDPCIVNGAVSVKKMSCGVVQEPTSLKGETK